MKHLALVGSVLRVVTLLSIVIRVCFEVKLTSEGRKVAVCLVCASNGKAAQVAIQYSDMSLRWQSAGNHMMAFHYDELVESDKLSASRLVCAPCFQRQHHHGACELCRSSGSDSPARPSAA